MFGESLLPLIEFSNYRYIFRETLRMLRIFVNTALDFSNKKEEQLFRSLKMPHVMQPSHFCWLIRAGQPYTFY